MSDSVKTVEDFTYEYGGLEFRGERIRYDYSVAVYNGSLYVDDEEIPHTYFRCIYDLQEMGNTGIDLLRKTMMEKMVETYIELTEETPVVTKGQQLVFQRMEAQKNDG